MVYKKQNILDHLHRGSRLKILIAGIGNKLYSDDGFGPRVIEELTNYGLPPEVDVIDYGTSVFKALLDMKDYDLVIFVDAIDKGGRAGEIYIIHPLLDQQTKSNNLRISLHEIDLEKMLKTAKALKVLPKEVIIVGCQPKLLSEGLEISEEVELAVEEAVAIILKILERKGVLDRKAGC